MTTATLDLVLSAEAAKRLAEPRVDFLIENQVSPGVFVQQHGPFSDYQRTLASKPLADGRVQVIETTRFRLKILVWRPLFTPLMRRGLIELDRGPHRRRWWPEEVITTRTTTLLSVLAVLSVVAGYLGVVIGQTMAFAAKEFGANNSMQANTLAALRVGVVLSAILIRRADRVGRRPLLLGFALASIIFTASGALSNDMLTLGITQALARGFDTGLLTLLTLAVTEEVPAGVRSLSIALMALATGFGGALVLAVLPAADISIGSWRIVFVASLAFLPVLWWVAKNLPETRRFDVASEHQSPGQINWQRFALLAVSSFCASLFLSPASQLQNTFLQNERGFSAAKISLFRILVSTPVGLVILAAGYIADRYGRKRIGSMGMALGTVMSLVSYYQRGPALWISSLFSVWLLGASITALRSYQTELFPTRARAKIGGMLDVIAVSGSALGLVIVGRLSVAWGSLGPALLVLLWAPLLVAYLVWTRYPETASQELEAFNPGDTALEPPSLE